MSIVAWINTGLVAELPEPMRKVRRHLPSSRVIASLSALSCLSGCALATDTAPSVEVLSVRLIGVGLSEQHLATVLCVTNPNRNEMAFRRAAVTLDVFNSPLASGSSELPIMLPPMSSTAVPFTVVTTVRNLAPQIMGVLREGSLEYRIHGTVTLVGALGLTLPFSRSGQFDPLAGGLDLASTVDDPVPSRCASSSALPSPT